MNGKIPDSAKPTKRKAKNDFLVSKSQATSSKPSQGPKLSNGSNKSVGVVNEEFQVDQGRAVNQVTRVTDGTSSDKADKLKEIHIRLKTFDSTLLPDRASVTNGSLPLEGHSKGKKSDHNRSKHNRTSTPNTRRSKTTGFNDQSVKRSTQTKSTLSSKSNSRKKVSDKESKSRPKIVSKSQSNAEKVHQVEKILRKKCSDGKTLYFVKWKGYPSRFNSWVDKEDFTSDKIVEKFERESSLLESTKRSPRVLRKRKACQSPMESSTQSTDIKSKSCVKRAKPSSNQSTECSYRVGKIMEKKVPNGPSVFIVQWETDGSGQSSWSQEESFTALEMIKELESQSEAGAFKIEASQNSKSSERHEQRMINKDKKALSSHPTSSISKPKPKMPSTNVATQSKPSLDTTTESHEELPEDEESYAVEKIVDRKTIDGTVHYLIKWKNYDASENSWIPEESIDCPDMVKKFNKKIRGNRKSPAESPIYSVEKILGKRIVKGCPEYLVKWTGYDFLSNSWVPLKDFDSDLPIVEFEERERKKLQISNASKRNSSSSFNGSISSSQSSSKGLNGKKQGF
jgi:hypothetical protein